MDNAVKVLDMSVANKIAAGEVVERPASVIKELVENSIDAGATSITIEISEGGTTYMRVSDNGCGMGKEDAKNCFLRHATSKIRDAEDLFGIKTLGFRGEALASVAAVSRVTLKTHRNDESFGTKVLMDAGILRDVSPCGCPDGTTIEVTDLFYNVPARLKFLKAARTEASYVSDYVSRMILAKPNIAFKFINGGNLIYQSRGDGDLKGAIYSIYGSEVIPHLRTLSYDDGYLKINGYIGSEHISRPNRIQQSFFVNGRYIKSLKLSASLANAYDTRMMTGRFPFAVLMFEIDYGEVDVNVHPNKLEIRFRDENTVSERLLFAARTALGDITVPTYTTQTQQPPEEEKPQEVLPVSEDERKKLYDNLMRQANYIEDTEVSSYKADDVLTEPVQEKPHTPIPVFSADTEQTPPQYETQMQKQMPVQVEFSVAPYEVMGCLFESFWLIRQDENLFILDQHAAHERMLYEQAMAGELRANVQMLLVPFIVKLSSDEYDTYSDNEDLFREFGFIIEPFGMLTVRITGVPHILYHAENENFFKDIISSLMKNKNVTLRDMKREVLIRASCKGAVKLGNTVPRQMIESILSEYSKNGIPLTCPHGRPVMVAITKKELFKMFKRIV